MIRLIPSTQRRQPRQGEDAATFLGIDTAVPTDTIDGETERRLHRVQHYSNLRDEIKRRDAELIKNRREENDMAVRLIKFEERKLPRSKVGKFTGLPDIQQAIEMLEKIRSDTEHSIEVTLEEVDYKRLKADGTEDPARSIVNMLKRKFENDGLNFKCYASDDRTVTIIKPKTAPKVPTKK